MELQEDISLRSLRLGMRTTLISLSPYHGRSVWNRGREHRIVTGAGASAFSSPFGFRSTERSLSEVQSAPELPCFLTVKSLRQYHAKGVLLPQYVAEGGRHSGFIPLTRESGMREACNVVARSRFRKTERKESSRLLMRHEQTVNRCTASGRVLRGIIAPILRRETANQAIDSVMRRLRTPKESVPLL